MTRGPCAPQSLDLGPWCPCLQGPPRTSVFYASVKKWVSDLQNPVATLNLSTCDQEWGCASSKCSLSPWVSAHDLVRESFPRQFDKKSGCPQGERGLEFSRKKKDKLFSPLSLYIPYITIMCPAWGQSLEKTFWLILLSYNVNYRSRSSEVFTSSRHSVDSLS